MYNIRRCKEITEAKEVMRQNLYKSPQGWEFEYLTSPKLDSLQCIRHMFTTRTGGVSKGIFSTLNLSYTRGDDEDCVRRNYEHVAEVLQVESSKIVCSAQTHTVNVRVVTNDNTEHVIPGKPDYTDVDGLITNEKGIVLAISIADCVPLAFVDLVKKVIGLSHSGWRGTVKLMGAVTIKRMQEEYGCKPEDIYVTIGPSICKECYEVSYDVAQEFEKVFDYDSSAYPKILYQKNDNQVEEGKYQLDLWKANELILLNAGILPEHIEVTDVCTAHNPDYLFSHRKTNGKRGNLGAFLYLI